MPAVLVVGIGTRMSLKGAYDAHAMSNRSSVKLVVSCVQGLPVFVVVIINLICVSGVCAATRLGHEWGRSIESLVHLVRSPPPTST